MEKREHFDRLRQPRCLLLLLAAGHVMVAGHLASNGKDTAGTESEFSFAEVVERGDRFPVVKTTSGLLRGERADFEALAISPIIRFLSVPYASPPLGDLRFTLPRNTSPWMGVRNATVLSAPCMQLPKGEVLERDGGGEGPWGRAQGAENNTEDEKESDEDWEGDEDCLYLNIYAPATAGPPRDCMVFLHGGGFVTGSARAFDPSILATVGDIIVVTLNYRLGPFGFLPEGEARGNAGLHDIAAALRWVHQNLPHFGGRGGRSGVKVSSGTRRTRGGTFDPGEGVTLAGWGAGATAASLLSLSQQTEGLISRLILQSGGALSLWSPSPSPSPAPRRSTLYSLVERLAVSLSCPLHGPVLLCLRRAPARDVALAAAQFPLTTFQPTIDFAFLGSSPKGLLQSGEFLNHEVLMGVTTSEAARLAPPSDLSRPRLRRQITKNLEEPDHEIRQGFNILQGFEPDFEENNIFQDAALSTLPGIGLKNIPPSSLPDAGSSQHFASTENSLVLPNSLTSNFGTNPQAPLTASFTTTISVPRQQPTALSVAHSAPLSPQIPAPLSAPLTASLPPSLHCRLVSRPPSPPVPDPHDPWGVRFEAAVQWVTRRHSGSGQSAAGTALGAAVRFMYTDWAAAGEGGTWSGEMNSQEERIGQTNMERENNGESDTFKERSGKLVEEGIEREKERKKVTQWDKKKADREHSRTTKEKEKSRVRMSRWREQTIALLSDALFLSPAMAEAELRARFGSVIYLYALTGSCGGGRHGEKPNKRKKRGIEEKRVNKTMASMKLPLQEREGHQRKTKQWSKKGEMGNLDKMMTAINERWRERIEKRKGLRRIKVRSEEGFKRDNSESEKQNIEKDGGRRTQRNEDENDERERKKHIAHKVRARKRSKDKREKEMQQEKLIMTTSRCNQSKTRRVKSRRLRREVSERERREVERDNDIRWERDRKSWREAGHGDELAYMFGLPWLSWKRSKIREGGGGSSKEYGQPSGIGGRCSYGERDAELSFLIMMYWANFVKTGNPNLRVPLTDSAGEVFTEQKADVDLHLENSKIRGNEKRTNFQPAILDQTSSALYPNVPLVTQGLKPSLLDDGNWAKKSDLPRHFEPLWPRFSTSRRRYLTLGSRIRVRFNLRATRLAFWSRLVPVLMATGNTRSSPRRYYLRPCFRGPHAPASKENWGERAAGRELEAEHEKGESWGLSYTLACGSAFLFLNLVAVAALNYVRDRGANQGGIGIRGHRGQNRRGWGIGSGSWGLIENRGLGPGDWGLASDNQGLGVGDWGLGSDSRGLATGSWGASEPDLFPTVDYVFTLRRSPHDLLPWREASGRTGGENRHEEEHEGETELRRC